MSKRNFREMLETQWSRGNFVCVGLDPEIEKLPKPFQFRHTEYSPQTVESEFVGFCEHIVQATADLVCAYKPNSAFFERHGEQGWQALCRIIEVIHEIAPDVPVILDAKRADIGNTNAGYVDAAFGFLQADAITVHPYLGHEALQPFLNCKDKGIFVLCRTSNPGAGEFQDTWKSLATMEAGEKREEFLRFEKRIGDQLHAGGVPLYQYVAFRVAEYWNRNGNCAVVVGATYPEELRGVRRIVGDMPVLIPGIGAQGGDVEKTVSAGKNSRGQGMIINSSRGIIFASKESDFAEAARRETEKLRDIINQYRNN